jgi:hypothetical protein
MKGRHALGCGWSAHEITNTIAKNAANSIVGKLTELNQTATPGCRVRRCSVIVSRTQRRSSPLAIR